MKIKNLVLRGLVNTIGIGLYIAVIAAVMNYIGGFADKALSFWGPLAFLVLFVLSAAITGALFIGEPILLYLDNKKKEAIKLFIYTVLWMILLFILVLVVILCV